MTISEASIKDSVPQFVTWAQCLWCHAGPPLSDNPPEGWAAAIDKWMTVHREACRTPR